MNYCHGIPVIIIITALIEFGFEQSYNVPEDIGSVEICTFIFPTEALRFLAENLSLPVLIEPLTAGKSLFEELCVVVG